MKWLIEEFMEDDYNLKLHWLAGLLEGEGSFMRRLSK